MIKGGSFLREGAFVVAVCCEVVTACCVSEGSGLDQPSEALRQFVSGDLFSVHLQFAEDDFGHGPFYCSAATLVEALRVSQEVKCCCEELAACLQFVANVG